MVHVAIILRFQLAHQWGIKTLNVVRDRPNVADLKKELKDFGADEIYTEEEVRVSHQL